MENKKKKIIAILLALLLLGGLGYYYANLPEDYVPPIPPVPTPTPMPTPTPTPSEPAVTVTTPEPTPTPATSHPRRYGKGGGGGGGAVITPIPTPTPSETHALLVCDDQKVCRPEGCIEPLLQGSNLMPGMDIDCKVMHLKNNGSDNGTAYMKFYNVNGTLADWLGFGVIVTENGADPKAEGNLTSLNGQDIELGEIGAGDYLRMRICWRLIDETPNEAQDGTVSFDMRFRLEDKVG